MFRRNENQNEGAFAKTTLNYETALLTPTANGGAKCIVRFFGGGGGETHHRARPPKPVLEASESGICLVCACFL